MKKILVTKQNLGNFFDKAHGCVFVTEEMIITPGAKDAIRENDYKMVYPGQSFNCNNSPQKCAGGVADKAVEAPLVLTQEEGSLEDTVKEILRRDYNIEDEEKLKEITLIVAKIINSF